MLSALRESRRVLDVTYNGDILNDKAPKAAHGVYFF